MGPGQASGTRLGQRAPHLLLLPEYSTKVPAKWDQGKWDQAKWDQGKWDQAKWDQGKWDQAGSTGAAPPPVAGVLDSAPDPCL